MTESQSYGHFFFSRRKIHVCVFFAIYVLHVLMIVIFVHNLSSLGWVQ